MVTSGTITTAATTRWSLPAPSGRALAVLALVAATFLWGTSPLTTKLALAHVPPLTLAFARVAVGYLALRVLLGRSGAAPARGRLPLLLGVTGFAGFILLRNVGLRLAPAGDASLIEGGATPALAMLLAAALLGERPTTRYLAGLLASLLGVAVAVLPGQTGALGVSLLGDGLLLVGTLCFAAYTVLGRRACVAGGSLAVVAGAMRYGLVVLAPITVGELAVTGLPALAPRDALLLLHLGVGCSGAAYALWGYGLSKLEAGQAAVFNNLELVFGLLAATAFLGEAVAPGQLAGAGLVLAGVWLATTPRRPRWPAVTRHLPHPLAASAG